MKPTLLSSVILLAWAISATAITIDTVPVGDVGNPNDPSTGNLYGGISYAYNIGKYEVTVGQYTALLNAVATTDTYSLYDTFMATQAASAGIDRSGVSGSYTYSVIGPPNHPVTQVSWGSAARFANWLHNGQPTGAEDATTTEDGAYTLNGATSAAALATVTRKAGALWFIPTENEWYKSAYYQPAAAGGDSDGYWTYPMKTNSMPYSDAPPGSTPDNTRVGNFYRNDGVANGYDGGFAVTGTTTFSSTQNYLTDVGAYASSASYYGTFDQAGNVLEWNETGPGTLRAQRGGSWNINLTDFMAASGSHPTGATDKNGGLGFRVASIPNPNEMGDFNSDSKVDAADFVIWRKSNGTPAGYIAWRNHFGINASAAGFGATMSTVPEPNTIVLAGLAVVASFGFFRRRD